MLRRPSIGYWFGRHNPTEAASLINKKARQPLGHRAKLERFENAPYVISVNQTDQAPSPRPTNLRQYRVFDQAHGYRGS